MKAASISFSLVLLAGCAAAPSASLAPLLWTPPSERARVSAMVVDLDTGEVVVAREAHKLCRPASTMNLLTSASICRRELGRAFRTRVVCDGPRRGQVTLVGDGDPHLSTADVRRLAVRLAEQGVTAVEGPLRVVDPLREAPRWGEGWMWDDEPSVFQPILSGATVDRGCVTVSLRGSERGLGLNRVARRCVVSLVRYMAPFRVRDRTQANMVPSFVDNLRLGARARPSSAG